MCTPGYPRTHALELIILLPFPLKCWGYNMYHYIPVPCGFCFFFFSRQLGLGLALYPRLALSSQWSPCFGLPSPGINIGIGLYFPGRSFLCVLFGEMGKLDKCGACQGLGNENIYQLCLLPASSAKYQLLFFRGIFPSPATSGGSGTGEE